MKTLILLLCFIAVCARGAGTNYFDKVVADGAGITNLNITNITATLYPISSNGFALNTPYTNGSQRAYVQQIFTCLSTNTGQAIVKMYVDENKDGVFTLLTEEMDQYTGVLVDATLAHTFSQNAKLGSYVGPNCPFVFSNLSVAPATVTAATTLGKVITQP